MQKNDYDFIDLVKDLTHAGMAIGTMASIVEVATKDAKNRDFAGASVAILSLVGRLLCTPFDTPKCTQCGKRMSTTSSGYYFCNFCKIFVYA